jgi:hypothetical protein
MHPGKARHSQGTAGKKKEENTVLKSPTKKIFGTVDMFSLIRKVQALMFIPFDNDPYPLGQQVPFSATSQLGSSLYACAECTQSVSALTHMLNSHSPSFGTQGGYKGSNFPKSRYNRIVAFSATSWI